MEASFADRFADTLRRGLVEAGITIEEDVQELLLQYAQQVEEGNRKLNLTRITSPEEMAIKHFVDSLACFKLDLTRSEIHCLDVGTGGGFPGIPLAICCPSWKVVLLDSLRKRLNFLDSASENLRLSNVHTLHARAEDAGQDPSYREKFDLVVSRAVARLPVLLELCVPFVKVGGRFIAMKGAGAREEVEESGNALRKLNCTISQILEFELPDDAGERALIVVDKVGSTNPTYPRRAGTPAKNPL